MDRSGSGKFVEVYPAAALKRWGFRDTAKRDTLALANTVFQRIESWLTTPPDARDLCRSSRDALDALVAALIARAGALNLCEPVPEGYRSTAAVEGWIALPISGSLPMLANVTTQDSTSSPETMAGAGSLDSSSAQGG